MLDGVFSRGTTPTQIFPLPGDLTMSDFHDFIITYRQKGKVIITKTKADCHIIPEIDSEKNIIVVLSQADTLLFNPNIKLTLGSETPETADEISSTSSSATLPAIVIYNNTPVASSIDIFKSSLRFNCSIIFCVLSFRRSRGVQI